MKFLIVCLLTYSFLLSKAVMAENFSEIRLTNRARCALDSEVPTESAFLLLNNMDIARSIYKLAKIKNEDPTELTKQGIRVYRLSVTELLNIIHKKITAGQLPLLPSDSTRESVPPRYKKLMDHCKSNGICPELDQYLNAIWSASSSNNIDAQLTEIDDFGSSSNFLNSNVFNEKKRALDLKCSYLRKFSPLEANLFGTKPTKEMFDLLGNAANHADDYLADCKDFSKEENIKVASFEITIKNLNIKNWNNQGFDYWNSLKIYFSWAFRNAPEMKQLAFPFGSLFSAVAIEDSVLLVPSGCKSITHPKCEADFLNQNVIRQFSANEFKKQAASLDVLSAIPDGAQATLLKDQFPEINKDILGLSKYSSSDAWAENFRANFSETRTLIRKNLLTSISTLDLISKIIDVEVMSNKLLEYFSPILKGEKSTNEAELKNQLYYVCAEYTFTSNDQLSFIKGKLDLLKKLTLLDGVISTVVDKSSIDYFNYFETMAKTVNNLCSSFDQNKVFDSSFSLDKTGFSSWYLDKVYSNKYESNQEKYNSSFLTNHTPYLSYVSYTKSKKTSDVICVNAPDCARKILKSIINIYAATQYADTFWNLDNQIKSPDLFNPYAERTACRVYDPWFKTKSTIFSAFMDGIQGALSTVSPGVIFGTYELKPGAVISFKQLVSEGKIKYDTNYSKEKIQSSLLLDFGNLLGVPCGVAVTKTETPNPYNYLRFNGISTRACVGNEKNSLNVNSASDIGVNQTSGISGCVVCSLNFEQVSSAVTKFLPAEQSTYFFVRALVNLYKGFKDPLNIPRSWTVKPDIVQMSYNAFHGNIPESCVYKLGKGEACMPTPCEEEIANLLNAKTSAMVKNIDVSKVENGQVYVSVFNCPTPLKIKTSLFANRNVSDGEGGISTSSCVPKIVNVPDGCNILK